MTVNRCRIVPAFIGLAVLTGGAMGAEGNDPVGAARASLKLQIGDEAILGVAAHAPVQYSERVGDHEFTGELLVRPKGEVLGVSHATARTMSRALDRIRPLIVEKARLTHEYVVRVPEGMTENELAAVLMATGDYEYAEPNWLLYPASTVPNDPFFATSWQHTRIQSAAAWDLETGDPSVIVAVCDTGVDQDHPDLQAALVSGYNARSRQTQADGADVDDVNGHGTFVAGCAAAIGNNGTGVVGAGWNFHIMPVRVTNNTNGTASAFDILGGARWAAEHGAKAINASYSGGTSASIQTAGAEIKAMGGLLFYAAGNDNALLPDVYRPDYVIVASTTSSDNKSGFSNYGPRSTWRRRARACVRRSVAGGTGRGRGRASRRRSPPGWGR